MTVAESYLVNCRGLTSSYYGTKLLMYVAYRVNIKKVAPPTTFVDILAIREDFCMKFYVTIKQSNIHFITKFG